MSDNDGHRGYRRRQRQLLRLAKVIAVTFFVFTVVAMLLYPGGTYFNPAASRYIFFENFFSDLGRTFAHDGQMNILAAALFFLALFLAGVGLILFFVVMPGVVQGPFINKVLSRLGSAAGIVAGLSFIGVAFTPADLYPAEHRDFVLRAFQSFFLAVLFYIPVIFLAPAYPNKYGFVFVAFAAILGGYVWLLFYGPDLTTIEGLVIQVAGQKLVVYAAIASVLIQAHGAEGVLASGRLDSPRDLAASSA